MSLDYKSYPSLSTRRRIGVSETGLHTWETLLTSQYTKQSKLADDYELLIFRRA